MMHFSPPKINKSTYAWSIRAFSSVKQLLGVNIKLHAYDNQVEKGDIFLFNHFARFETFIPQYLIYQEQKAYCRSVASSEFFRGEDAFTRYLHAVGAVPNNMPNLLSFLAKDILCGNKIIIFPEGGMVKDKKILSEDGTFSIFSPTAKERRKHHSGAARLALLLDIYKQAVLNAFAQNDQEKLNKWREEIGLDSIDLLVERCKKPTRIIPSNITFYPIRISTNFLKDAVERLTDNLPQKFAEELVIEGNLVFKNTDMDIRMGQPIESDTVWSWWEKMLAKKMVKNVGTLNDLFTLGTQSPNFFHRLESESLRRKTDKIRDQVMQEMYGLVTINLSHIASALIIKLLENGVSTLPQASFLDLLYLSAKFFSHEENVHLHRSLLYAETYRNLRDGYSEELKQFLRSAQAAHLISLKDNQVTFMPKLQAESDFHNIRMENPICVYANECAAIPAISRAIDKARDIHLDLKAEQWAEFFFEDDLMSFYQAKEKFSKPEYEEINKQQTATKEGAPFYLTPERSQKRKVAVLAVHGFLASPAEMRSLGDELAEQGYWVYGPRLVGHGTSPCDLRDRSWSEWMRAVKLGYDILASTHDHIIVVGFSTGGALSLRFAVDNDPKLAGLCAVSTPLRFANPNLVFVPLIHHANRLAKWLAAQEGILPYIVNDSEHPDINYRHIPIRALHELRLLVDDMEKKLPQINVPTLLMQGDQEKVVKPESAQLIASKMTGANTTVKMIPSTRHGIVTENIAGTRKHIIDFVNSIEEGLQNG